MSNSQVGKVFEQVIRDVCDASLVDFEEGGVGGGALEDLKSGWEKRLTHMGVAAFPWDPAPPPPPPSSTPLAAPTTVPSNAPKQPMQSPSSNNAPLSYPHPNPPAPGPRPKQEASPKISPPVLPPMNGMSAMGSQTAQQRAASQLQQRYGNLAATQISQLSSGGQRPQGMQMPSASLSQDSKTYPMPQPTQPAVTNAQTDGAGDSLAQWKAEVAHRRTEAAKAGTSSDHALMEQIREKARQMEGGGLMVPLDEQLRYRLPSKMSKASQGHTPAAPESSRPAKAQYDGPGSDDEDIDEDAINSDLDDPDDPDVGGTDDEDDSNMPQDVMLCTYDKVQRVKNKWKCTLKDGLMTTGGKEYVFHKAQGEFEW